jgi:hypothetical protein
MDWAFKAAAALVPLLLGALVTLAWQNSHALVLLTHDYDDLRVDYEKTKAALEPGRTIMLRFDIHERELAHLRDLVETRMACPAPPTRP